MLYLLYYFPTSLRVFLFLLIMPTMWLAALPGLMRKPFWAGFGGAALGLSHALLLDSPYNAWNMMLRLELHAGMGMGLAMAVWGLRRVYRSKGGGRSGSAKNAGPSGPPGPKA